MFATYSQKIKSHVVESHIRSLVWPCLSLTEKQRTVNHKIIFNDSIITYHQCSVRNSLRQLTKAEAFTKASLCFLVSASAIRIKFEAIKFLGILKKYVYKNKIYFCLKKEKQCFFYIIFIKIPIIFIFHAIIKLIFIAQINYCIIYRCLYSLFILFLFSCISF